MNLRRFYVLIFEGWQAPEAIIVPLCASERGAVRDEIDSVIKEIDRALRRRQEDQASQGLIYLSQLTQQPCLLLRQLFALGLQRDKARAWTKRIRACHCYSADSTSGSRRSAQISRGACRTDATDRPAI